MAIKTVVFSKDEQLSEHFALHEFKCKESNVIKYSEETIALLEEIFSTCRNISKAIITSGYRTPEYSVKVGGTKDDGHTVGIAVDIKWYNKNNKVINPKYIACIAQDVGFTGIGLMKNSIHLDTRTAANYKNGKWWGDETNGKNNITDFYAYSNLSVAEVNSVLGRMEEIKFEEKKDDVVPVEPPVEPQIKTYKLGTSLEDLESATFKILQNAIARAQATGKNVYDNDLNIVWEYVPIEDDVAEGYVKENASVIVKFFTFLVNLIKKIMGD